MERLTELRPCKDAERQHFTNLNDTTQTANKLASFVDSKYIPYQLTVYGIESYSQMYARTLVAAHNNERTSLGT
jgi:hypothetical protein